ncbi:MAG: cobalamin B12-binding domain-containing protein, partial [Planctomycetota bacterium]
MKVLLVNPPIPKTYYNTEFYLPLSLLYIAAVLRQNGEEVKILDLKIYSNLRIADFDAFYSQKIIDTVSDFKPEMIGFGCLYSGQFPDILRYSELLKSKNKDIPIVMGGIHPTLYPREILTNCPSIDFIVIGEGEDSFIRFINEYKSGRKHFDDIDGFAYRADNKINIKCKMRFIENLDSLPFPAYDLVNMYDYDVDTSDWFN